MLIFVSLSILFGGLSAFLVVYVGPGAVASGTPELMAYLNGINYPKFINIKTLIVKVLGLTADTISEKNIKKYKKNIIQIKNVKIKIMDFNIDRVSREKIIELGYISAEEYLNNLEI
jgi:hypothetical protein